MKIDNLKELQKIIQLCRKLGVNAIKIDNVEFALGAEPKTTLGQGLIRGLKEASAFDPGVIPTPSLGKYGQEPAPTPELIETDELTEEQLIFYSTNTQLEENRQ